MKALLGFDNPSETIATTIEILNWTNNYHLKTNIMKYSVFTKISFFAIVCKLLFLSNGIFCQDVGSYPFNEYNWQVYGGELTEHSGRQCLKGTAALKEIEFKNGIVEFDLYVTGDRSYPGIRFRAQSQANAENIYIRPHIIGHSEDALQYTPIFNMEACWQLYNGEGYTSGIDMPLNEWVHFKLEVSGSQARVYIGKTETPSLKIDYLQHGISKGGIALTAPPDGSAYFSNFKIDTTTKLNFYPPLEVEPLPGIITHWKISQQYKYSKIDLEKTCEQQGIMNVEWQSVQSDPSGLVNLSKQVQRRGREPDFIFAKTDIYSDKQLSKEFGFGYSDWIVIFLNGELLFTGSSPYQGRGKAFLGITGFWDAVMLPLKKGKNELELIIGEQFGGWGFMFRDNKEIYTDGISKLWESEKVFTTSESVLYDPGRDVLYVTNFDQFNVGNPKVHQFISKVSLNGKVEELKWVDGLNNPLGMTLFNDRLFVAERKTVAEIDLEKGEVIERHPLPASVFINDIAIDKTGSLYITDSRKNVIWKYADGEASEWLVGDEVLDPNVIYIKDTTLYFGNSGDQSLKSVNLKDKTTKTITKFETGFIDGFRIDQRGNYLVSLWKGKIYRVTPDGKKTKILDGTSPGNYSADFEYIARKNLLIVPTFFGNTIAAYKLNYDQVKFSAKEVREDLKYLYETLDATCYDLFHFTDKSVFEKEFDRINNSISDSLTKLEIHRLFQPFVALSNISHINLSFPVDPYLKWIRGGGRWFPLEINFVNEKPLIVIDYKMNAQITKGDELISINGDSFNSILNNIFKYTTGETEYYKRTSIESGSFTDSYWYVYGDCKTSTIEIKKKGGSILSVEVEGVSMDEYLEFINNHPEKFSSVDHQRREFKFIRDIAYLHPGIFFNKESTSNDINSKELQDNREFYEFIDSAFYKMAKKGVGDLIIDIRRNNGGSDLLSNYMLASFASGPFTEASWWGMKTSQITKNIWKDYHMPETADMKEQLMLAENGTRIDMDIEEVFPRDDSLHFNGNVYVLIDRFSFSNAAAVATVVQDFGFGTLIGEETSFTPSSCGAMGTFKLPNTLIEASFTRVCGVRPNGDTSLHGVIPEIIVKDDIFTDEDEVLEYTVERIQSGKVGVGTNPK